MQHNQNHPDAVRNLQRYLRQIAFEDDGIPMPPEDGIYDSRTEEALHAFQKSAGLPVGAATPETWEALYASYRASLAQNSSPLPVALFPRGNFKAVIGAGYAGFAAAAIRYMLGELFYDYSVLDEKTYGGVYDGECAEYVRRFQHLNGLPETGEVDLLTWNTLTGQYNRVFAAFY